MSLLKACTSCSVTYKEAHLFCRYASKLREAVHKLLEALHVEHGRLLSHLCLQEGNDRIIRRIIILLQHSGLV